MKVTQQEPSPAAKEIRVDATASVLSELSITLKEEQKMAKKAFPGGQHVSEWLAMGARR